MAARTTTTGASAARPLLPEGPRTRDCPRRRRHIRAHLAHVYAAVPHERRSWKPLQRRRPAVSTASRIAPRRSDRSDRLCSPPILSASSLSYSVSFVRCLLRAPADPPPPRTATSPNSVAFAVSFASLSADAVSSAQAFTTSRFHASCFARVPSSAPARSGTAGAAIRQARGPRRRFPSGASAKHTLSCLSTRFVPASRLHPRSPPHPRE